VHEDKEIINLDSYVKIKKRTNICMKNVEDGNIIIHYKIVSYIFVMICIIIRLCGVRWDIAPRIGINF